MSSEDPFQFQYDMGDSVDFFGDPEGFFFIEDNLELRNVPDRGPMNATEGIVEKLQPPSERQQVRGSHAVANSS